MNVRNEIKAQIIRAGMTIDNLPEPPICLDNRVKEYVNNSKHFSESIEKMDIT